MMSGDFDSIEEFVEVLKRDIAILGEIVDLYDAEERELAEIAAVEERINQAIELGTRESLQDVYDFIKEFSDTLNAETSDV